MSLPPSDPAAARFIPGSVLVGRYRVIECIGSGGSGEVYRADDLKLGQPVALKFLSADFGEDSVRFQTLCSEVRLARQVSHPGVCRVHDIVEVDGTHALSMEFVDGEDVASLLRRIGRLPADRAVTVVHELCAGLGAIHERGVIHRDLKPANVMIDGRGHARIADFGLADLQGVGANPEAIVGTPAYMAPEALRAGHTPTIASDLYSLGLIMYELFTGRAAYEATTVRELMRIRAHDPVPPSQYLADIDPEVERTIMRCLDPQPERRPASARAVAAAMPGGDPLAAAIAAGGTPAPELIGAATNAMEGLRRMAAWSCLGALVLGLGLITMISPRTRLVPALTLSEPAEVMAGYARELLRGAGHDAPAADRAYGYDFDESVIDSIAATDRSRARWASLSRAQPPVATFWYRESTTPMVASAPAYRVTYTDPAWAPGMVGVRLDGAGALMSLDGASLAAPPPAATPASPVAARIRPGATATGADSVGPMRTLAHALRPALFFAAMLIGAWLARRNLRAGRCDTRRALRLASAMMVLRILVWLLSAHHTLGSATEQLRSALAWGLYDFAYGWLFYIAIEPSARRFWPRLLTSWARLVDGQYADARVGRDVLIGCLVGTALALLVAAHQAAPVLFGTPPNRPDNVGYIEHQLASLLGFRQQFAEIAWLLHSNIVLIMGFVVILVVARLILRNAPVAIVAAFLIFVPLALPRGENLALDIGLAIFATLALFWTMLRFGLLPAAVGLATHTLLQSAPLGMGMGSWPTSHTVVVLAMVLGAGVYGFSRSLVRPDVPLDLSSARTQAVPRTPSRS